MAKAFAWVIYNRKAAKTHVERGVFNTRNECQRAIDKQLELFGVDIKKNFTPKKFARKDLLAKPLKD